jgi:hypothetical protein
VRETRQAWDLEILSDRDAGRENQGDSVSCALVLALLNRRVASQVSLITGLCEI